MKIEVKLYHYHDLDLVCLYRSGRVGFTRAVRMVLNAYGNKEYFRFSLLPDDDMAKARPTYRFIVNLDEDMDKAAIEVLDKIEPGFRNNFIKTVLRQYMCAPIPKEYYIEGFSSYFDERTEGLCKGKTKKLSPPPGKGRKKRSSFIDPKINTENEKEIENTPAEDKKVADGEEKSFTDEPKNEADFVFEEIEHVEDSNKDGVSEDLTDLFMDIIG